MCARLVLSLSACVYANVLNASAAEMLGLVLVPTTRTEIQTAEVTARGYRP